MNLRNTLPRVVLPLAIAVLPLVLLYSSIRTFHELAEQRSVYLRHRVALLAARLESLPPAATPQAVWDTLSENEPGLLDVSVISPAARGDTPELADIWSGKALFHTEATAGVFRAYVPFHSGEGVRIARIDLDPAAADFLMVHARHNVLIASLTGLVLVLLSIYSVAASRRAARLQLRQLQLEHLAHMGKMAAALAHEIRNPLGTIKGFVQLAAERADAPTREMLEQAAAESERLERLVNDLLAYGRPPEPVPAMLEWNELAAALAANGRQWIGSRPISLSVAQCKLVWRTDPSLLKQALLNLLRNAIEAIPAGAPGEVRIEVQAAAAGVTISVLDSGAGFSDAAMARIFEPFFTTKPSGTGLGLAITRSLVRSLDGELLVRRRDEGGAAVIVRLPQTISIPVPSVA